MDPDSTSPHPQTPRESRCPYHLPSGTLQQLSFCAESIRLPSCWMSLFWAGGFSCKTFLFALITGQVLCRKGRCHKRAAECRVAAWSRRVIVLPGSTRDMTTFSLSSLGSNIIALQSIYGSVFFESTPLWKVLKEIPGGKHHYLYKYIYIYARIDVYGNITQPPMLTTALVQG